MLLLMSKKKKKKKKLSNLNFILKTKALHKGEFIDCPSNDKPVSSNLS